MTPIDTAGIILFAHGSRDPLWHRPMQAVAACILAQEPQALVACAYLELSTPDLDTAVDQLVTQGARSIRVLPLFLGAGKHAREDLPRLVAEQREKHPGVRFTLQPSVGEDLRLVQLLATIALDQPENP
jgi:sirohydrochlorin cobaltochelatase